jgi:hypothetical protein
MREHRSLNLLIIEVERAKAEGLMGQLTVPPTLQLRNSTMDNRGFVDLK